MCEYCHFTECPSSCPNAPEPPIFDRCKNCGDPIYVGEEYYETADGNYCEECVHYKTAEI